MPIDIHGLQKRYESMKTLALSSITESVKAFRSTLQGRKKELLKPFGLDDLDKFKDNPKEFVDSVKTALDSFGEKKEQDSLYKRIYEDDRCIITVAKDAKGAAAAGSLLKRDGDAVCPWCVAVKYPDNEKWYIQHKVKALFFVYAKENGVVSDAWCLVLTIEDCHNTLNGKFTVTQVEDTQNQGNGCTREVLNGHLDNIFVKTGLNGERLCTVFESALTHMRTDIESDYKDALLAKSIEKNNLDECRRLLDDGANVNAGDNEGWTPLILAARSGNPEICKMLLKAGANVNACTKFETTPLMMAASSANPAVCRMLLGAGADVNARNCYETTALMMAAENCTNASNKHGRGELV